MSISSIVHSTQMRIEIKLFSKESPNVEILFYITVGTAITVGSTLLRE